MNNQLRNPWHDINAWKEFRYDMRHPIKFLRAAKANVNNVPRFQRRIGAAVIVVGGLNILVGVALVVLR